MYIGVWVCVYIYIYVTWKIQLLFVTLSEMILARFTFLFIPHFNLKVTPDKPK